MGPAIRGNDCTRRRGQHACRKSDIAKAIRKHDRTPPLPKARKPLPTKLHSVGVIPMMNDLNLISRMGKLARRLKLPAIEGMLDQVYAREYQTKPLRRAWDITPPPSVMKRRKRRSEVSANVPTRQPSSRTRTTARRASVRFALPAKGTRKQIVVSDRLSDETVRRLQATFRHKGGPTLVRQGSGAS